MALLLPIPGRVPRRGAAAVYVALALSAYALALPGMAAPGAFPGHDALPDGPRTLNLHARAHEAGLEGLLSDDHLGFPGRSDRAVLHGAPLAAFSSAPFHASLGWEAGMWAWALCVSWALGAGAAWIAMRWWGRAAAGLVAGVALQSSGPVLRAWAEGRSDDVFAACLLAPALACGWRASRARWAAAAGAVAGLALAVAPWAGAGAALLGLGAALGASEGRRGSTAAAWLAGFAALAAFPLAWAFAGRHASPSFGADPWLPARLGLALTRPVDLASSRVFGADGLLDVTLARPVLLGAALAGAVWARARAWILPASVAAVAAVLGLGSWLPGPVVLPWGLLQSLPLASRAWAPEGLWTVVAFGLALLAAGATARVPPAARGAASLALCLALAGEAGWRSGSLPLPSLSLSPSQTAEALDVAPDVPLVLLPTPGGPFRSDRLDLLDQVHHGRPLANDAYAPLDLRGSDGAVRAWTEHAGLRALLSCELDARAAPADGPASRAALMASGLREVWMDARYVDASKPAGRAYQACVTTMLEGWERTEEGPFVRWRGR